MGSLAGVETLAILSEAIRPELQKLGYDIHECGGQTLFPYLGEDGNLNSDGCMILKRLGATHGNCVYLRFNWKEVNDFMGGA